MHEHNGLKCCTQQQLHITQSSFVYFSSPSSSKLLWFSVVAHRVLHSFNARAVCTVWLDRHAVSCSTQSSVSTSNIHHHQLTSCSCQASGPVLLASTTPAMVGSTSFFFVMVLVACMFYLCALCLPSSVPMADALELEHQKSSTTSSSSAPVTLPLPSFFSANFSKSGSSSYTTNNGSQQQKINNKQHSQRNTHLFDSRNELQLLNLHYGSPTSFNTSGLFRLLSREHREPSIALSSYFSAPSSSATLSSLPLPSAQAQIQYPTFTILAILPEENAPAITRALREAQTNWEASGHTSAFKQPFTNTHMSRSKLRQQQHQDQQQMPVIRASDIPLVVNSEPAINDTTRILAVVCEWIVVHKPAIVLSLLDRDRNFYASLVAQFAGIPFISLTQTYRNEISTIRDDHQLEVRLDFLFLSLYLNLFYKVYQ